MTTEDENNRLLFKACADGDLPTASGLVDRVSDINWHNPDDGEEEYTFLHLAAEEGKIEVCKLLLDKGADLKAKTKDGQNVLYVACLSGHLPVAQLLMDRDTTLISEKDKYGKTVLDAGCMSGNLELVKLLLDKDPGLLTQKNNYEETVLHAGCISGNLELVKLLLDKDPGLLTQKTNRGATVLHFGCYSGNLDLVKFLAEKDPEQLKQKDDDDMTILHYACQGGNLDMVLYLVSNNLSIYDKDAGNGTSLHWACQNGKWTVVQYLLNNGLSLYDTNEDGDIPLKYLMNYVYSIDEDKRNKQYCLQQLKTKGEEFLKPEDLAKIQDADLQSSNTSPTAAAGTDTVVPTEGGGAVPTAATDPSSEKDSTQPLDRNTVDGLEQQKIDYRSYLKKASNNGTVSTKRTNLGLGGAAGIGKTSTLKLLTDQEPDTQHDSTDVLKPINYFAEVNDKSTDEEEEENSSTDSTSDDEKPPIAKKPRISVAKSEDEDTATDSSTESSSDEKPPIAKKPRISVANSEDEDTDTDTSSTAVVKSKPRPVKQYLIVATKKKKWNPATQQALLHRLASCVVTLATENESSEPFTHKSRKRKGPLSMERKLFFHKMPSFSEDGSGPKSVPNPTSDAAKNLQKMSFDDLEAAQKIIDFINSNDDLKELGLTHFVNASDTGGQAAFIDIAPALMRFNSINLVLFRLDKKLDGLAKFFYSVKGKVVGCEKRQITTKSLIYSMIASKSKIQKPNIKGMEVLQTQNKSMFMIIGTHLDRYKKLPKDSRESLEEKEKVLKALLHEFKDCIIPNGENIIFSLNTLSRDKKTRKMAATIRELAMQYYIEAKVPVSWYIFQVAINEIKVSKNKGMIPISKLIEVGKYIKIFEEEVRAFLQYFHESSVCQYYPDVLPGVVFATPQFLFEKISELVSATLGKICPGVNWEDLEQFKQCGIFTMSFLKHVCKGFEDDLFTAEDFLKLMAHLFIISQLLNDDTPDDIKYFMPSVLQIAEKPFDGLAKSQTDVEPLLFTWNNTVPNGLFPSLITSMLSSKGTCHFTMSPKAIQYRNKITFNCEEYASLVTLIDGNSFIAIAATCSVQSSCVKVREAVLNAIDRVVKRFNWQDSVAKPKEVFPCKAVGCAVSADHSMPFTHFSSRDKIESKVLVCSEDSSRCVELTDAHLIWYGESCKSLQEVKCTLPSILKYLQEKSADWDKIGSAFGISFNDRQNLLKDSALNNCQRLEAVLYQWIESSDEAVTWSDFINILTSDSLNYKETARKVRESFDFPISSFAPTERVREDKTPVPAAEAFRKIYKASGLKDEKFKWEEMGITIHTPAGIVPTGTEYCTITVTPVTSENCIFPANCLPVSGIFDITTSSNMQKSIKVQLEHSVILSAPKELKAITFAKTRSHDLFTLCKEGKFTVGSHYGVLECKTFSKIAIFLKELFHIPIRCSVQLLHAQARNEVHAVFTQNTRRLMQLAIAGDDFRGCEKKESTTFVFSSNRITVETSKESEDRQWKIVPMKLPCIEKDEVIHFDGNQLTPKVGFCFNPHPQSSASHLSKFSGLQKFSFTGATESDLFLLLRCTSQEEMHSATRTSVPTVMLLVQELRDLVADWEIFASQLPAIEPADIVSAGNFPTVETQKLALYTKWLEKCRDASWTHVKEALEAIDENVLAERINDNYILRRYTD